MTALKTIVNINRETIIFYNNKVDPIKMTFSKKAVDDLEVKDDKQFEKEITKFVLSEKLKPQNIVIALGEEILFTKNINTKDSSKKDKAIQDFLDEIPFQTQTLVHKEIPTNKGTQIVVANTNLFTKFINVISKLGWKVKYVVPVTVFGPINLENIKELLENKQLLTDNNLYTFENKEIHSGLKVGLGILVTLLLGLGAYYYISNAAKRDEPQVAIIEENIPIQPENLEIEEPVEIVVIPKEEITIQVLNGSGINGQAGKTQILLNDLGFTNIEIGNAQGPNYSNTEVIYSSRVSEDYIEEISNILKETYENVLEKPLQVDDTINFDIVITTGELITSN